MSVQPNSRALFRGGPWPREGVYLFSNSGDCLAFMFGPSEPDEHVKAWQRHRWLKAREDNRAAVDTAMIAFVADLRERDRARREAEAPALNEYCRKMHHEFLERRALRERESARAEQ